MLEVRRLEPDDDRSGFRSGNPELDRFFARYAGQNQFRHHVGTTYVAMEGEAICGFVTVSASEIAVDALPKGRRKRLPRYPLPVLRLARLAVSERHRGRGLGELLLETVFRVAPELRDLSGCVGVVVDAKSEAVGFYRRYGFERIDVVEGELGDRPGPLPMFLSLGAVPDPRSAADGEP